MKKLLTALFLFLATLCVVNAQNAPRFVEYASQGDNYALIQGKQPLGIYLADKECKGLQRAVSDLCKDIKAVTGSEAKSASTIAEAKIVVSTITSDYAKQIIKKKKIDAKQLQGKVEKFVITTIDNQLVILGSDMRGAIYGVYELSEQMGVSPWYWWADVAIEQHSNIYIKNGSYTAGEPVVRYRGIFLNDEAPCLSGWVKEKFPDSECPTAIPGLAKGMNSNFYEHVFELLLRLKANYMWPAMWGNAFYADDPRNGKLAAEMDIMMGTSHHEPMARNHQEWARHRKENGPWDYDENQQVIDKFFREGIRRAKNNEDLITIGMRGDGDTGLGGKEGHDDEYQSEDEKNLKLMERIFKNQRQIIAEETGKPAEKRQQVWALYKEVQHLYDIGLRVPEDVLILLCDDNWGNIRNVPKTQHKGGWGMYYHVDYVGAPRSS
ncbi:MAG: glycosyl hydrolase 115 family protein, partial [Bacteroidales bacterium]|nr:glycosyl hydrolase 115 family protein [Bacteroidales bacterium]